jgi:hypothetical protein
VSFDPHTADSDSPEGAAVVDAAARLMTEIGELTPGHRAAFEAACAKASKASTGPAPAVAGVWSGMQQLVRAVRVAAGDPVVDLERLARLKAGLPGPTEEATRTLLARSPEAAQELGIPALLEKLDRGRPDR